MQSAILGISFVCAIASFACFVMLVIAAFDDEVWKAVLGFFVWPYLLYWAIVECYDEGKWTKIIIWVVCAIAAPVLRVMYVYYSLPPK
jgi:hypothetical protein